jgi:hypothetical protein
MVLFILGTDTSKKGGSKMTKIYDPSTPESVWVNGFFKRGDWAGLQLLINKHETVTALSEYISAITGKKFIADYLYYALGRNGHINPKTMRTFRDPLQRNNPINMDVPAIKFLMDKINSQDAEINNLRAQREDLKSQLKEAQQKVGIPCHC